MNKVRFLLRIYVRGLPERPEKLRLVLSAVKTKVEGQEDKTDCKRKHGTSPVLFDEFVGSAIRWNFSCRWPFIMAETTRGREVRKDDWDTSPGRRPTTAWTPPTDLKNGSR